MYTYFICIQGLTEMCFVVAFLLEARVGKD